MKLKNFALFVVIILAILGLVNAIGYAALAGRWMSVIGAACLGYLSWFRVKDFYKEITKVEKVEDKD